MCQMEHRASDNPNSAGHTDGRTWDRLTPDERSALANAGHLRRWRPGQFLAAQGDQPGAMFVILRGQVKIWAANDRGDRALLAIRGPAEIIGELAAISGIPRTATIEAIDEVHALTVSRERLQVVLRRHPRIAEELLRTVAIRLRQSDRLRLEAGGPHFAERLAAILVELATQLPGNQPGGNGIELQFTQGELAGFARVSRSTLIRGLDELRRRGAVETAKGRIRITHLDLLAEIAAGGVADGTT